MKKNYSFLISFNCLLLALPLYRSAILDAAEILVYYYNLDQLVYFLLQNIRHRDRQPNLMNESMTSCKLITYNGNMSLAWNISDDQMEKCIREVLNADSKQMHTVLDDTNNGIVQFFYTLQQPFIGSDTPCYSNDTMDEIYNITIVCVNSTEPADYNFADLNESTEYYKPLPGKWNRIVRVGLASFSVFLAAIIVCIILFLLVVLLKCIQRLLLVRRMPQSQHAVIKHVISDMGIQQIKEDVTQESSRKSSAVYHRKKASALKLLHLKDMRPFI